MRVMWLAAADNAWHAGIGDPTFSGWFTFFAYFASALFCARAALRCRSDASTLSVANPVETANLQRLAAFWGLLCVVLVALGINKQLDLQSLMTEKLRAMAQADGWYEERHRYQSLFIKGLALGSVMSSASIAFLMRRIMRRVLVPIVAVALLACFVVARAALFNHNLDELSATSAWLERLSWVFELAPITLLGISGYRVARAASS